MFGWFRKRPPLRYHHLDLRCAARRLLPSTVRAGRPGDHAICRELYVLNEPGRFPAGILPEFAAALEGGATQFLVVEKAGEICGCGGIALSQQGATMQASLSFGLVHPHHHRRGFGTTLLLARLALLPTEFMLAALMAVPRSRSFYERFGFRECRRVLVPNGEEMPILAATVSPDLPQRCAALLRRAVVDFQAAEMPVSVVHSPAASDLRNPDDPVAS